MYQEASLSKSCGPGATEFNGRTHMCHIVSFTGGAQLIHNNVQIEYENLLLLSEIAGVKLLRWVAMNCLNIFQVTYIPQIYITKLSQYIIYDNPFPVFSQF